jgi:hypothetical protein
MPGELLPRLALVAVVLGTAGYFGLGRYSQPRATYDQIEPVRAFLRSALTHDSAGLAAQAGDEQPTHWALEAVRLDSAAILEWVNSRPGVRSTRRGDTAWVTLRRSGSTERCSFLHPLTARFLDKPDGRRLVHLSSSCPPVARR